MITPRDHLHFSIDDATGGSSIFKMEAGAPSNSLYVDDDGNVGINTSNPLYELHIMDGDSPTVRLDQDGSYGWEPQKWDLAGNETNFFIRDATHASKLPFRIQTEAPSKSIFIESTGNAGMGTHSPAARLHIQSTIDSTEPLLLVQRVVSGASKDFLTIKDNGDVELLKTSGQGSDRNLKRNIRPVDTAMVLVQCRNPGPLGQVRDLTALPLELYLKSRWRSHESGVKPGPLAPDSPIQAIFLQKVSKLPLSTWNYKSDDDSIVHMGPMAQDFYTSFGLGNDDKHITPIDSSGVALAAIQELYKMVEKQNEMLLELQEKNARLEARLKDM